MNCKMTLIIKNVLLIVAIGLAGMTLGACQKATAVKTTRYTASDMMYAADEVKQQLAMSNFLASRTPDSPVIRLVPREMENRSSDRLSRVDQKAAVARVLHDAGMQDLLREKAIQVQWSPEEVASLRRHGIEVPPLADADLPTHIFRAEFGSIPRAAADEEGKVANERIDRFFVTYSILELNTRQVDWSGQVEFARYARGKIAD